MIISSRPRHAKDFYITPGVLALAACRKYIWTRPAVVLDAGAGTGVWGQAAKRIWPECRLIGVEMDPAHPKPAEYDEWLVGDFLTIPLPEASMVIGNPPFSLSEQFIRRATDQAFYTLFLLRLAFLESKKRQTGLWQTHRPAEVSVLAERIPWQNHEAGLKGKTDDTAHAMYFWSDTGADTTTLDFLSWKV